MSELLTESQLREQDFRLYGPDEAIARATQRQREEIDRQLAQNNLAITQNTPGLGSNGEGRQERDGYKPECDIPVSQDGLDVCREGRSIAVPAFENSARGGYVGPQGPNPGLLPVRALSPKTGYEPAADNRQVPSPTLEPWPVLYQWVGDDGLIHHGNSVGEGRTQEEAERKFFRQHPHVQPLAPSQKPESPTRNVENQAIPASGRNFGVKSLENCL